MRSAAGFARMCLAEARPVVQIVFLMRFLTGLLLGLRLALRPGLRPGLLLDAGPHRPWLLLLGAAAWSLGVVAVYLVNGVMDVDEDRANGSRRPIATGALPARFAGAVVVLLAVAALGLGAAVPGLDPCLAGLLLLGYLYSGPPLPAKRTTITAAATVAGLGILTYLGGAVTASTASIAPTPAVDPTVGGVAGPGGAVPTELLVFGGALSLWMGAVGAVAKDLSDIPGDAAAGRRSLAVVRGERAARRATAVGALLVGSGSLAASVLWAPLCLYGTVPLAIGAGWVALRCRRPARRQCRVGGRAPYRAFMITQYAAHATMLSALLVRQLAG